jgi:hypothetical protein
LSLVLGHREKEERDTQAAVFVCALNAYTKEDLFAVYLPKNPQGFRSK